MMKKLLTIRILFIFSVLFYGFTLNDSKTKTFYSLSAASKTPKDVYKLDLMFKGYNEFPNQILEFKNLENLILRGNQLKDLPIEIKKLKKLKELSLGQNPIQNFEKLFESISGLKNLEELDLEMTGIKSIPKSILKLKKLKTLYLWNNPIDSLETIRVKALLPEVEIQ